MGYLSQQEDILHYLREQVSRITGGFRRWPGALDYYCKTIGYQAALPVIDEWLEP